MSFSIAPPRKPRPLALIDPFTVAVPSTITATMPPVLPFQAAGTIDAPALTVRLLYCGTRTTCAPPL
ncbi:MAG: hypothetical protein J0M09_17115 [Xanthomonadales bacterium]|nr:hypothetical protein [Xanthomonadales bacterium]